MKKELVSEQWYEWLQDEFKQEYFEDLLDKLSDEYSNFRVQPAPGDVFKVFKLTDPSKVRVVIIGQDPYPYGNHADGIAFSSKQSITPASLQIILRELDRDLIKTIDYKQFKEAFPNNDLRPWLSEGVFPLNSCLTVRAGVPNSHQGLGWTRFTEKVLELLWENEKPKVFIAWGEEAKKILSNITGKSEVNHMVLEAGHPATAAHGKDLFSGCNHFSKVNRYFEKIGETPINWKLNG